MKKSVTGYKKNSPDKNEDELLIDSSHITTQDMAFPIWANGKLLMPDTGDYFFPEGMVHEKPLHKAQGGYQQFSTSMHNLTLQADDQMNEVFNFGPGINKVGLEDGELNDMRQRQYAGKPSAGDLPKSTHPKFKPDYVPALGLFNAVGNKLAEHIKTKQLNSEYQRMQTMSNIPTTTVPTQYGQYGNPYVYQEGGGIGQEVIQVPEGFKFLREDKGGVKIYNKKSSTTLPMAKPSSSQGSKEYEDFLKAQLQSGISPDELVKQKYISPENITKYSNFYIPKEDFIHTKPIKQKDPYENWSGRKEQIHADNKTIAEMWYPSTQTDVNTNQGNLNTSTQKGVLRFRNDFGFTGEELPLDAPEIQQYLGASQAFKTTEDYQKLLQLARDRMVKKQMGGQTNLLIGSGKPFGKSLELFKKGLISYEQMSPEDQIQESFENEQFTNLFNPTNIGSDGVYRNYKNGGIHKEIAPMSNMQFGGDLSSETLLNPSIPEVSNQPQPQSVSKPLSFNTEKVTLGKNQGAKTNYVFNYIKSKGIPDHVAAGITGNLAIESGYFDKNVISGKRKGDGGKAVGIAQWHPDRWGKALNWFKKNNLNPYVLESQIDYVIEEAGKRGDIDKTITAKNSEEAAYVFGKKFERPNDKYANWSKRQGIASSLHQFKEGGEYELSPDELLQFLQDGGEVEYIIE